MRKDAKPARREGEVGLEQPLEFQERLFVEDDVIDGRGVELGVFQAVGDGVRGEIARRASCGVKRSSCAAATISPSSTRAAALS